MRKTLRFSEGEMSALIGRAAARGFLNPHGLVVHTIRNALFAGASVAQREHLLGEWTNSPGLPRVTVQFGSVEWSMITKAAETHPENVTELLRSMLLWHLKK